MQASYKKYTLQFKNPSGTSRGVLRTKDTYFIIIKAANKTGIGETGFFKGLSADNHTNYEEKLAWACNNINLGLPKLLTALQEYPSIQFGLEQAFLSLQTNNMFNLFNSNFTTGKAAIPINGLIWMGDKAFMKQQIKDKLKQGFTCIKMKIGAIDFEAEVALLKAIRREFSEQEIELRVDANGAFKTTEALKKLDTLSKLKLHSIEQPIQQGQLQEMALLCQNTPLPIALDEELIGAFTLAQKTNIITTVNPQYIILKPSLVGGFKGSQEWIDLAETNTIKWWITSALESNIGLNAIAQFTYTLKNKLPQGLGTGSLFTNNIESPLEVKNGALHYNTRLNWQLHSILK